MTEQKITPHDPLKSRSNFENYMAKNVPTIITSTLANYVTSKQKTIIHITELTQNFESFLNIFDDEKLYNVFNKSFIVWTVTNEKEKIIKLLEKINQTSCNGFGIFVFKASLNNEKLEFNCILKPYIKKVPKRNENTPAKLLQREYWEKYFEICDELQSSMQITPAPRHYQYISIGKKGVQIMQTVNTKEKYIASELFINNNQEIYEKLYAHKEEIENELGELDWQALEGKKSSRIRKQLKYDFDGIKAIEKAMIKEHIKMAEEIKTVISNYL